MNKYLMVWFAFIIGWWGSLALEESKTRDKKILWSVLIVALYAILLLVDLLLSIGVK